MGWGVDGGWMPLPTRPQRFCDPASLVVLVYAMTDKAQSTDLSLDSQRTKIEHFLHGEKLSVTVRANIEKLQIIIDVNPKPPTKRPSRSAFLAQSENEPSPELVSASAKRTKPDYGIVTY